MRALDVYLCGKRIGNIEESRRGARFRYSQELCDEQPGSPVLSLSLPVKRKPFGEARTRNWFEGLLPEGERRDRICGALDLSTYDWVGLLGEIGRECAGAVQVVPSEGLQGHAGSYVPVDPRELARRLSSGVSWREIESQSSYRMSLGGFQDKLCVYMPTLLDGGPRVLPDDVCLTQGDAPSTHILKPEPQRYPGLAESEAWAMTVAGHAVRCARVALLELDGGPSTLVVERYDRRIMLGGMVTRLHQEDACQALGLPIANKYANETMPKGDDPTYKNIAGLIDGYAVDAKEEKLELLRQLTVNMALGNWDAHAKNTSFLYSKLASPVVAPLYDVVPISEMEPRTNLLSMRVNGSLDPASIDGRSLLAEGESWGLTEDEAREAIMQCLDGLEKGLEAASGLYAEAASRHEGAAQKRMAFLRRLC